MKTKTLIIAAAAILLTVVTASGQIDPKVKVNISAHVIGKIDKPKKKYVFLVRKNKAQLTEVTTGISDATHVAIVSGIKAGDPVITGPFRTLKKLKDGASVTVVKEEKKVAAQKEDK